LILSEFSRKTFATLKLRSTLSVSFIVAFLPGQALGVVYLKTASLDLVNQLCGLRVYRKIVIFKWK